MLEGSREVMGCKRLRDVNGIEELGDARGPFEG